jgi:hypothetical protein
MDPRIEIFKSENFDFETSEEPKEKQGRVAW